ncbi:sensor domain-containing diguanylate cyclase [Filobacillus milosensis]|uniref:Sensor domain-containing diguanylate cyclase n=1 Tax=Filobacillus milosensis TaxID=94137 RepID=A0A4Y8IFV0_9BACI|nr:sensor domain-containing diguanylate cyclase [Filobacillus milosensis]TFB13682.1 sensor domain-containing diguanylate cyclase [Filobacillus milosensis]
MELWLYIDRRLLESMINKLEETEHKYASLINNNIDAVFSIDLDGKIMNVNETGEKLLGISKYMLLKQNLLELMLVKDSSTIIELLNDLHDQPQTVEMILAHRDGSDIHCLIKKVPMIVHKHLVGMFVIVRDITSEKRMHQAIYESEERIRQLLDYSPSAMFIHVIVIIRYANQASADLLEINSHEQLIGRSIYDFHPVKLREEIKRLNERLIEGDENERRIDEKVITLKGKEKTLDVSKIITTYKGERAIHSIANDVSHRKEYEEKIKYMALHDQLTGLPNRRLFDENLKDTFELAQKNQSRFAIMYINCDNFKLINDELGHDIGDEFLKQLAEKLEASVREGDIVARIGGDEFNILLINIQHEDEVISVAKRILDQTNTPLYTMIKNIALHRVLVFLFIHQENIKRI